MPPEIKIEFMLSGWECEIALEILDEIRTNIIRSKKIGKVTALQVLDKMQASVGVAYMASPGWTQLFKRK